MLSPPMALAQEAPTFPSQNQGKLAARSSPAKCFALTYFSSNKESADLNSTLLENRVKQ